MKTARVSVVALLASLPCAALAASLPSVTSGARPGPDILYASAPSAPQLENAGVWSAAPILVSGASAYRGGEFLYQDFLYDDHGAAEQADPADPRSSGNTFSRPDGTYTYPTDPAYANDAADLVELRLPISSLPITVQLLSSDGVCWEAVYSSTLKNGPAQLRARSD